VLLNSGQIVVEDKQILLVGVADLLLEIPTLDGGGQVDLARGQATQHDRGYGKIDGISYVAFPVFDGAATVEDDHLLDIFAPEQRQQPIVGDGVLVAFRCSRHLESNPKHPRCDENVRVRTDQQRYDDTNETIYEHKTRFLCQKLQLNKGARN
jgi:hypothetical protein